MRAKQLKIASLFLVLLALQSAFARDPDSSQAVPFANRIAWQPNLEADEYIEAWSFTHRQNDLNLYITFLVSNLGPGDLNNGLAVLLFYKGKSHIITAEYSQQSLTGRVGQAGMRLGRSYFRLCGNLCLNIRIRLDELRLDLRLTGIIQGPTMNRKTLQGTGAISNRFYTSLPVLHSSSSGSLFLKEVDQSYRLPLKGQAGMETIRTDRSPHHFVNQIQVARNFSPTGLYMGYLLKKRPLSDTPNGQFKISQSGQILFESYLDQEQSRGLIPTPFTQLKIARTVIHYSSDGRCRLLQQRNKYMGGFAVLDQVSFVLRWVLKIMYSNPHILHFQSSFQLQCQQADSWQTRYQFVDVISSVYVIK